MTAIVEWLRERRIWLIELYFTITQSLWFRPIIWLVVLSSAAFAMVGMERIYIPPEFWEFLPPTFRVQPGNGQAVLSAVVGAFPTVVSLAFSIMMLVVIQTATSYTPRLLRKYISDKHNHHVLGFLMGSFTFAVIVMRSIQAEPVFVPQIAVNAVLILSIGSIIALISFINHVARSIEVGNIIKVIERETRKTLDERSYQEVGEPYHGEVDYPESGGVEIRSHASGYVRLFDLEQLARIIDDNEWLVRFEYAIGEHVVEGTRLATVWTDEELDEDGRDKLGKSIRSAVSIGRERTQEQDVRYGFQQLTEIALRALSPGINDPTTANMAMDAISALLAHRNYRGLSDEPYRANEDGELCVVLPEDGFDRLLAETLGPIVTAGADQSLVVVRFLDSLGQLAELRDPGEKQTLSHYYWHARDMVEQADWSPRQKERALQMARRREGFFVARSEVAHASSVPA